MATSVVHLGAWLDAVEPTFAVGALAVPAGTAYVLGFFALLTAAGAIFAIIAGRAFEREKREAEEQDRLLEPQRNRARIGQERNERRQRLLSEIGSTGKREAAAGDVGSDLHRSMQALHRLHDMLMQAERWEQSAMAGAGLELCERAERLYDVALGQVERGRNLGELIDAMPGVAADRMRERQRQLIEELGRTIETLAAALDQLHASAVAGGFNGEGLGRLRDDMDERLRIAAGVERRLDGFEAELEAR